MTNEREAMILRPLVMADASSLAALYSAQRDFLAPFEPVRSEAFFTEAGQREVIAESIESAAQGRAQRFAIIVDGQIVGVLALSNIVRRAFQSTNLGYFVAQEWNGRGIATRAVCLARDWAFDVGGLHRLEAATLLDNIPSQRVLLRNGFRQIGLAPHYLQIAGAWRDHLLFATTVEDR